MTYQGINEETIAVKLIKVPFSEERKLIILDKEDVVRLGTNWQVRKTNWGWSVSNNKTTAGRVIMGLKVGNKGRIKFLNGNSLDLRKCNMDVW